jgi:hypothetical protein
MPSSWPAADFPNLKEEHHSVTSPATREYNCIAWAAGDTQNWWWPDEMGVGYWPSNVPREPTILAFVLAYGTVGFMPSDDGTFEVGFEKIALYSLAGEPTHAARQLPNGRWTSKLGDFEDIEHADLACLGGPCYGQVATYLKRPTR